MSDDIVKRLRAHTTGTTLCPISRGLTAIAADEIERLRAELAAERELLREALAHLKTGQWTVPTDITLMSRIDATLNKRGE